MRLDGYGYAFFERKEDGVIIYHGQFRGPGYIITEEIERKLKALYTFVFTTQLFVIFPIFSYGNRLLGLFIAAVVVAIFYYAHGKLVKDLPISPYPRQRFPQRVDQVARNMPIWGFLSIPILLLLLYFVANHFFTQDDHELLAFASMIFLLILNAWALLCLAVRIKHLFDYIKKRRQIK
ncbi:hypothetical protein [Halotalea alkalilenta]|uniref:Uncharacterized protein n=1 Tax=Halotalea alkalilenta TaxID=376489 RepID=A0A172YBM5_9GAMM|nr:hypothetical protein [Halotalea alkalilenta]ANF56624.1 hypothetical protein A5892_03375 [Halotalea alkalilenta]